nr:MAG TPA: hypothetical protein [Caudoviricetes sp.]
MEDFELKVGDLVKLRDDLIDGKEYNDFYFRNHMKFKGFKSIVKIYRRNVVYLSLDNEYITTYSKEMLSEVKRPIKYETIYKREEPILDDKEKEYLSNVIRPFKDEVIYIVKKIYNHREKEYIAINLKNDTIFLPNFKENTMYKNMKINKEYTLEELGL